MQPAGQPIAAHTLRITRPQTPGPRPTGRPVQGFADLRLTVSGSPVSPSGGSGVADLTLTVSGSP